MSRPVALVAGLGPTLGTALSMVFTGAGYRVVAVSRTPKPKSEFPSIAQHYRADLSDEMAMLTIVDSIEKKHGPIEVFLYSAAELLIKPFMQTEPGEFENLWRSNCLGAMVSARCCLKPMLQRGKGSLLFTGATASMRGAARFSAFSSSKFALRALAQSLAREFGKEGLHIGHVILDGLLWGPQSKERFGAEAETCIKPDEVARAYLNFVQQERSCWTHELDLRPYCEKW